VPILHGDQVLGVLNVEGDQPFDALDRISLEIIAEHLGTAIVNARLFERTRQLAVLEERQRLARDLHDNVTQIVSSMSLLTQSLVGAWQREPAEAERRSARLGELARLACAELREMLHELAPPSAAFANAFALPVVEPPQPLPERLAELLQAMVPPHVQLSLETDGLPVQAAAHDDTIVRICQEAVSNAVRHALPSRIQVSFAVESGHLRLSVSDDGKGMPPRVPRGMGLNNLCQRLHELDGTLQIRRRRPRGTSIVARLPLSGPEP
jgi:signal transduction histidine kinase